MSFISSFLEHTKEYEAPTSFWRWSSYATISAILRDSCFRRFGDSTLFCNIYTLLLGGSGSRKNLPVVLSQKIVHSVGNTKVISGRASIQAILDELSRTETDRKTGRMIKGGSAIFYAPELTAGLVQDPQALSILTDIYDGKVEDSPYTSRLRTQVNFNIERLVFSIFVASNEALARDLYNQQAKEGGLLARTFLILPNEFRPRNDLMDFVDTKESFNKLIEQGKKISEMKGEFVFSNEAKACYRKWYIPFGTSLKNKQDKTGVLSRIHTGILKISMVLAADELSLEVRENHVEEAIFQCINLIPNYNMFTMTSGKGNLESAGAVVLQALLAANDHKLSQRELIRDNWATFDLELLDKVTVSFEVGGLIIRLIEGSVINYKLTPKCLEILGNSNQQKKEMIV